MKNALANGRFLFGGIADARNGKGAGPFDGTWKVDVKAAKFESRTFICCKTGCITARRACRP
jgi:hypothetical protein